MNLKCVFCCCCQLFLFHLLHAYTNSRSQSDVCPTFVVFFCLVHNKRNLKMKFRFIEGRNLVTQKLRKTKIDLKRQKRKLFVFPVLITLIHRCWGDDLSVCIYRKCISKSRMNINVRFHLLIYNKKRLKRIVNI